MLIDSGADVTLAISRCTGAKPMLVSPPTPVDAVSFAAGRGRSEFPCLSTHYSPASRIPCADFSRWLHLRISANDVDSIADFVWRVVEGNPGVGLGGDGIREHWKENARRVLGLQTTTFLRGGTTEAEADLRAVMILVLIHDSFNGFIMASDAPRYLATVMIPHAFQPTGVEELVKRGNRFIKTMRKDTPFWYSFPLFSRRRPVPWQEVPDQRTEALLNAIRLLPVGTRSHFFDLAGRYGQKPLPEATSYTTRKRGLDEVESALLLQRSGLVTPLTDVREFLLSRTYAELNEIAAKGGLRSKTWPKNSFLDALIAECPDLVSGLLEESPIYCVAPVYQDAVQWAQQEIDRRIPFWQVWAGFGLHAENQ